MTLNNKTILAVIFTMGVKGEKTDVRSMADVLEVSASEVEAKLRQLEKDGLVENRNGQTSLSPKGRRSIRVVFIGGGFEVIHYGHVYTIDKAKELGDVLVVSVARDSTIRRRKGREPLVGEGDRVRLLSSLRQVDAAILGVEGDIYVTLQRVSPDVVALGYDQYHLDEEIRREASKRGLEVEVVRLDSPYPDIKTSRLLKEF